MSLPLPLDFRGQAILSLSLSSWKNESSKNVRQIAAVRAAAVFELRRKRTLLPQDFLITSYKASAGSALLELCWSKKSSKEVYNGPEMFGSISDIRLRIDWGETQFETTNTLPQFAALAKRNERSLFNHDNSNRVGGLYPCGASEDAIVPDLVEHIIHHVSCSCRKVKCHFEYCYARKLTHHLKQVLFDDIRGIVLASLVNAMDWGSLVFQLRRKDL